MQCCGIHVHYNYSGIRVKYNSAMGEVCSAVVYFVCGTITVI